MRSILIAVVLTALTSTSASATTGFFQYEIDTPGPTKQCVYDALGSTYVITVKDYRLCPITIRV